MREPSETDSSYTTRWDSTLLVAVVRSVHVAGLIDMPLEWAVPAAANLRSRALPR